ncbi:MAG: hypothetical protein L0Z62_11730 [Gemmataceae bacterium]|nr:hypothetical protein [Gemmataceae bacterium]
MYSGTGSDGLIGVWGSGPNDVYAVGDNGLILHSSDQGATWAPEVSGTTSNLTGVWGSGSSIVYAVGANGTILRRQTNVVSVPSATPEGLTVTLESPAGTTLTGVNAQPAPEPDQAPPGATFPVGVFSFTVEGAPLGQTTPVVLYMPTGIQVNTYYKFNPATGQWDPFLGARFEDRNGDGTLDIVLVLTDGGQGDADGVVNGTIQDPGLPAFVLTPGASVHRGQTAGIGFWHHKNGQNLIKSLNGGPGSTRLADWLAAMFPNLYGSEAGASNLTGKSNVEVADFYKSLFMRTGESSPGGPLKLDAQILALALAVYVTNQQLAGNLGAAYGFEVAAGGVGFAPFNVGSNGSALGVADNTTLSVLAILQATDARAHNGLFNDLDESGTIDLAEQALREMVNQIYTAINEQGAI